jgi:hypothetical protein
VKVPLAQRFAKSHSIIDKLCEYMLFSQSLKTEQQRSIHRMQTRTGRRVFYESAAGRGPGTGAYAVFLQPPCRWNSSISAARPASIADNFLLKQQKQRERRFAKRALW